MIDMRPATQHNFISDESNNDPSTIISFVVHFIRSFPPQGLPTQQKVLCSACEHHKKQQTPVHMLLAAGFGKRAWVRGLQSQLLL